MASVYDDIQQRLRTLKAEAPQQSNTAAIRRAVQAKAGKAVGTGGRRRSSVGEQVAVGQADAAAAQQAGAQQLQAGQLATQAKQVADTKALGRERLDTERRMTEADLAANKLEAGAAREAAATEFEAKLGSKERQTVAATTARADQALAQLLTERNVTEADIFAGRQQSNQELASLRDRAALEQELATMALANRSYVAELERVGAERRLKDANAYQEETMRLVLGDALDETLNQLDWQEAFNADQRRWEEAMAGMDADTAMAVANSAMESANKATVFKGVAGVAGAAAEGYADQKPAAAPAKDTSPSVPRSGPGEN